MSTTLTDATAVSTPDTRRTTPTPPTTPDPDDPGRGDRRAGRDGAPVTAGRRRRRPPPPATPTLALRQLSGLDHRTPRGGDRPGPPHGARRRRSDRHGRGRPGRTSRWSARTTSPPCTAPPTRPSWSRSSSTAPRSSTCSARATCERATIPNKTFNKWTNTPAGRPADRRERRDQSTAVADRPVSVPGADMGDRQRHLSPDARFRVAVVRRGLHPGRRRSTTPRRSRPTP